MKYDTDKAYEIIYWDPKRNDHTILHTDSLATAIIGLITRSRKHPDKRIDMGYTGMGKSLGIYEDGEFRWQLELAKPEWQEYISYKLSKYKTASVA